MPALQSRLFCVLVIVLGLIHYSQQITLPWGPFIISRSGRSRPSDSWGSPASRGGWRGAPFPESQEGAEPVGCCPVGLKTEVFVDQFGEVALEFHCPAGMRCCAGLQAVQGTRANGHPYSACVSLYHYLNTIYSGKNSDIVNLISQLGLDKKNPKRAIDWRN